MDKTFNQMVIDRRLEMQSYLKAIFSKRAMTGKNGKKRLYFSEGGEIADGCGADVYGLEFDEKHGRYSVLRDGSNVFIEALSTDLLAEICDLVCKTERECSSEYNAWIGLFGNNEAE